MSTVELMLQSKKLIQLTEENEKESDYDLLKQKAMSVTTISHFPHNSDYTNMISAVPTQGSYPATLPGSVKSDRIVMKLSGKQGFKPLDSSSSIVGGKIHSLNGHPHEGTMQKATFDATKKIHKSDEQERTKFISVAPTLLKDGPLLSLSFSSPKTTTKVVMSTVAKRVPLLSTGPGNVSKVQRALIEANKIAEEATKSNGSLKSVDTCDTNGAVIGRAATLAPSILAARLTAPRPSSAATPCIETEPNDGSNSSASELLPTTEAQESPSKEGQASVTSVVTAQAAAKGSEPITTISLLEVAKPITVSTVTAEHEVPALLDADSCATSHASRVSGISSTSPSPDVFHTTTEPNGAEGLSVGKKYQVVRTMPQSGPSKQCVLSYEKGLTRLAAVERRTLTLVDVGMQVFIPGESKPHLTATESMTPSCVHNHLSKIQAGLPISKGSTVPVISTTSPLTLNTKTGKLVVAVPKQVLNTTSGPQTFIIGGKPVTVQIKGSLGQVRTMKSDGTTTPILPTISGSKTVVINSPSLVTPAQQGRDIAGLSLPVTEMTTPSIVVTTASIATPPQSKMYPASALKTPPRDGDSLVLPLNSPIQLSPSKDTSENASVQALPNTTSLLIMIPNSLQPKPKLRKLLPSPQVVSLTPEVVLSDNSKIASHHSPTTEHIIRRSKRPLCSESTDVRPTKIQCVESSKKSTVFEEKEASDAAYSSIPARLPSASPKQMDVSVPSHKLDETSHEKGKENIPIEQMEYELHIEDNYQGETSNTLWSSIDTILPRRNSQSDIFLSNKDAKQEVNLVVKNALSDFRNCLVPNKSGDMPIHVAVQEGNPSAVQRQCIVLAARKAPLDLPNGRDETPLQVALFCGFSSIVKVLLQFGADPTVTDKEGNSTLHLAVLHADEEAVCALLTTKKLKNKIDDFNDEGFTALHLAAHQGKDKVLTLLVEHGASIDLGDAKSGRTALYHAIERRQYWAQKELLKHGADLMEPSFTGTTPLSVTRSDMFAQLNSGQQEVIDVIDADTLMKKNHRRKKKQV